MGHSRGQAAETFTWIDCARAELFRLVLVKLSDFNPIRSLQWDRALCFARVSHQETLNKTDNGVERVAPMRFDEQPQRVGDNAFHQSLVSLTMFPCLELGAATFAGLPSNPSGRLGRHSSRGECGRLVDPSGLEPLTSSMPLRRSAN